jgi:hypothetical protein
MYTEFGERYGDQGTGLALNVLLNCRWFIALYGSPTARIIGCGSSRVRYGGQADYGRAATLSDAPSHVVFLTRNSKNQGVAHE